MKKLLVFAAVIGLFTSSCRKIEADNIIIGGDGSNNNGTEVTLLEGKITKDRTLKAGNTYTLRGIVYVTGGAKLTIEPGTVIHGETSSKGALVITRGAQINADGTKDKPIVFTSDAGSPKRGDWGGVVICGKAPTNASFNGTQGVGQVEGGVNNGEGLGLYGGTDAADNSGTLKYVRIEYAGYAYLPDNELNGLTLAGVGSGTTIDYVEIFKANDDAIECFGGTVNLRHTIFISTLDDDFDTDNGYSGTVQFGIVLRDSAIADVSKSESWESDNDANGSALTPQTSAVYSNITAIGPRATTTSVGNSLFLCGAQIRRNSSISIYNSVIMGYPVGVLIDASKGVPTDNNIQSGKLNIKNTIVAGCATPVNYAVSATPTGWTPADAKTWFTTALYGNSILATNDEVKLAAAFNYTNPDFTPQAGSPLLTGGAFSMGNASSFSTVTFRGAVGPAGTPEGDWWKGWSKLNLTL
ncbi:hypothetical protein [Chitinophaga defluvii]|uniref:T9SS C-terminal target domain-containing protein n=1 Tax=Chitinophaga defluvii TaxID=3163343 RepID=A0ABV2T469_9BACT